MTAAERLAAALADIQMFTQRPKRDALMLAQSLVAVDPTLAQDIEDGAALRRLRESMPERWAYRVWFDREDIPSNPFIVSAWAPEGNNPEAVGYGSTIAEAADACREAIEAQR